MDDKSTSSRLNRVLSGPKKHPTPRWLAASILLFAVACGTQTTTSPTAPATSVVPSAGSSISPTSAARSALAASRTLEIREYAVPAPARPHDVAPAADRGVWYTGQGNGTLGHLEPTSGNVTEISLGSGSAPHGVIVDGTGVPWITDGGLNAIVRVDPVTGAVKAYRLSADRAGASLNTAGFDTFGMLWFTGQSGLYGSLDPKSGEMHVYDAPGGRGPYGIAATRSGDVYYASLAGSHIARVSVETGAADRMEPPTSGQGARRVWQDSRDRIWVSQWNAGQVGLFDPADRSWREWRLPGSNPQAYAVLRRRAPVPGTLLKPSALDNYFVGWSWWSRRAAAVSPGSSGSSNGAASTFGSLWGSWRLVLPIARS